MSRKNPTDFERRWRAADAKHRQALNAPSPDPLFWDRVRAAEDQYDALYEEMGEARRAGGEKESGSDDR